MDNGYVATMSRIIPEAKVIYRIPVWYMVITSCGLFDNI